MTRLLSGLLSVLLAVSGCGAGNGGEPAAPSTSDTSSSAAISMEQARTIALAAVGGGQVTEVEVDDENNSPVWKVTVVTSNGTRHRVSVDQRTGAILVNEVDK
jgi:uncharacterized membrane protein YkoI